MADEDEIDIVGDFSFNSCFAQNDQGIPSCSDREDTVHPQWFLDSTANNWYDLECKNKNRNIDASISKNHPDNMVQLKWSKDERDLLTKEMVKYGRNVQKISQTLKTKTAAQIQALIDAEYGVNLDIPILGLYKHEDNDDIPTVVQEEIVTDDVSDINDTLNKVTTGSTTILNAKRRSRNRKNSMSIKNSEQNSKLIINSSDLLYEDDITLGSTELVGTDLDSSDIVSKSLTMHTKENRNTEKKIGSHRRKTSTTRGKTRQRNKSKGCLSLPRARQNRDTSLSEGSPKMKIVLGSGQSLQISEGEQVIKIEKIKDSELESDIDVDIDSDVESSGSTNKTKQDTATTDDVPVSVLLKKFEPLSKRQKKINLDGGGGYTIMHTEKGDLYQIASEPRKERPPRKHTIHLIQCQIYNAEKPAPYSVVLCVSALVCMDVHAHVSRGEVMGLVAGSGTVGEAGRGVCVRSYRRAAAAAAGTHCDMDPVSQARAAESLRDEGFSVCGWHHSHPLFPPSPSALDLHTQQALQEALERSDMPFLGFITSQHWPTGRTASQYRCIRIEDGTNCSDTPIGYQFSVKLVPDLNHAKLPEFFNRLQTIYREETANCNKYTIDLANDICPQAGITYLEKCISSVSHHMRSAGYSDDDSIVKQLIEGIRDIFR